MRRPPTYCSPTTQAGGYGHRDHVHVHHVGARAAAAGPADPEGPRRPPFRGMLLVWRHPLDVTPATASSRTDFDIGRRTTRAYSPRAAKSPTGSASTGMIGAKRASMRAHASQATTDRWRRRPHARACSCASPDRSTTWSSAANGIIDPATGPAVPTVSHDIFDGLPCNEQRRPVRSDPTVSRRKQVAERRPGVGSWPGLLLGFGLPLVAQTGWDEIGMHLNTPGSAVGVGALRSRRGGAVVLHLHPHRVAARPQPPQGAHSSTSAGRRSPTCCPGGGAVGMAATYYIARSWGFTPAQHLHLDHRERRLERARPPRHAAHRARRRVDVTERVCPVRCAPRLCTAE